MGSTRHAREVNRARAAYIGAARQVARLMQQIDEVPIDPGAHHPLPWTDEERALVAEVAGAWGSAAAPPGRVRGDPARARRAVAGVAGA